MTRFFAIFVSILLVSALSAVSLYAQPANQYPKVDTNIDPTSGTVGEKFTLTITATAPDVSLLSALPLIEIDEESTWTLLSTEPETDSNVSSGDNQRVYSYVIAPFETGQVAVPRVAITYAPAGSTSNTVLSEPLIVSIDSVIAGSAAGSNLRDVKRPVALPLPKAVVWSGAGLLLVIMVIIGWLLWRRYSARLKRLLGGPLSPDEKALKEINDLETERLIEQKKIKEFYTRLSDAVREYLAAAYGVHATDLTSNEMLRALDELAEQQPREHSQEFRTAIARLTELLDEADLVKFARLLPDAAHCRRALQIGRDVVGLTRYRFIPEDTAEPKTSKRPPHNQQGTSPPPSVSSLEEPETVYGRRQ